MFRYADLVRTGDEVLVERKYELTPLKVISISSVKMQGNKKLELKAFHSVFMSIFLHKNKCVVQLSSGVYMKN